MMRFPSFRELVGLFRPATVDSALAGIERGVQRLRDAHDNHAALAEAGFTRSHRLHDIADEVADCALQQQRQALRALRAADNLSALVK